MGALRNDNNLATFVFHFFIFPAAYVAAFNKRGLCGSF